jgi:ABC-2 type transport system ATP-binding protein
MICVEQISKYYGSHAAISDITFSIEPGKVVGLLGLNGAGKTTTLRILSGLLWPTEGKVRVGAFDMAEQPEKARSQIGFLPERPPLYPEMRVEDFLIFVARIHTLGTGTKDAVQRAMAATDLLEQRHQVIGTLSNGYQRRVGIAHAIVHRPKLILLDEPTSGLDPVQIIHMRRLIESLKLEHTVIVSSHLLGEVQQMCDRVLLLHEGHLLADGSAEELLAKGKKSTSVHMEVRGTRQDFEHVLESHHTVSSYDIEQELDGVLAANVELKDTGPEDLVTDLVRGGIGMRRLEQTANSLESVFLQLTHNSSDQRTSHG